MEHLWIRRVRMLGVGCARDDNNKTPLLRLRFKTLQTGRLFHSRRVRREKFDFRFAEDGVAGQKSINCLHSVKSSQIMRFNKKKKKKMTS